MMAKHSQPSASATPSRWGESKRLLARAKELIPGGFHLSSRPLLGDDGGPVYMQRGAGARVWDVDGHEYVDFFMGFGPFLLGYAHPEVDAAACAQLGQGTLLSMSHPLHLHFIETLLAWFPGSEMGAFFKTGSEATTAALRIARRATGRRRIARAGYHGWHDWCLPLESFVPRGLDEQVLEFRPNEAGSLERALASAPGEVAAVIVAPEMFATLTREALEEARATTHRHGALFVLDEVKTAFRTKPGSVQERFGVRPDITTVSKALGNGWPVAAVLGTREVMRAGAGMHYSATFHGDTASMAAALKVLAIVRRDAVDDYVWCLGERLIDGLNAVARRHRVPAVAFGEPLPPMPFLRFELGDPGLHERAVTVFYEHMLASGFLLHPRHLWFTSAAHTVDDVDRLLDAADEGMRLVSRTCALG